MEEDGRFVAYVAADFIRRFGANAPNVCREKAELDDVDILSAEAWRDIADEAERQLREKPSV